MEEVKYTFPAEKGKQCQDCRGFQRVDDENGKCFGKDVKAEGGCNMFSPKEAK
ncbi:hypothetical protein Ctha_2207 [Chloroherpeton thalassium ATCC 35110]|uniref:High-potential iron-sulfur protein n=1 Tax=Chloroherpeton thalassium (strain ATCC 35110 / GB-78) TaxID=517418 RepID=B3QW04_CHLT3|nr:hypothetical protein [Chloroherpeton thalassium]ACF14658.1 hypothetical protein Ctha_2207 [Chloroherpeton thalassium ATCC 35110]